MGFGVPGGPGKHPAFLPSSPRKAKKRKSGNAFSADHMGPQKKHLQGSQGSERLRSLASRLPRLGEAEQLQVRQPHHDAPAAGEARAVACGGAGPVRAHVSKVSWHAKRGGEGEVFRGKGRWGERWAKWIEMSEMP